VCDELDPNDGATQLALAAHGALLHDFPAAEERFGRAVALDPKSGIARAWFAIACLLPLGRGEEARREPQQANILEPVSNFVAHALILTHYCLRDYDEAIRDGHKGSQVDSAKMAIARLLSDSYIARRAFDEAWFFI
jgi:tetratricopeptide (TPR) repeat protein